MAVQSSLLTKAVSNAMQRIAPTFLAGSWDNVGLLLGWFQVHVVSATHNAQNRQLHLLPGCPIALTPAVCDEAIALGAGVVVSYHTPIFSGLKSLTLSTPLQASLLRCAANGVSVYSPHSALDGIWGGINDWLAEIISGSASERRVLLPATTKDEGGDGRRVELDQPTELDELVSRVKAGLGLSSIQVGYSPIRTDRLVRSVAICAGSGASMFAEAKEPVDVYFTGEMQHHEVLAAVGKGTHVILCGHTNTERGYLPLLKAKLQAELLGDDGLGEVEVVVSASDKHPLEVV
ncbi:hypothetical protein MIND_01239700 [Mycena indigotica]|uniref:NGG1p interacting factor 3 n=1 Tax=Mycena indigotica TaxID=2126181 RepID=A0A8H6VS97_9AGAR|nr:uncharacterized protein MIND_01239700 [Mycena indigotica]KAF7292127.1 hypothetical protein MIND_01239700 [Mycena indigotica]